MDKSAAAEVWEISAALTQNLPIPPQPTYFPPDSVSVYNAYLRHQPPELVCHLHNGTMPHGSKARNTWIAYIEMRMQMSAVCSV